ncbi:unnamed protein product, partial [Scytosiphon promiscuus]
MARPPRGPCPRARGKALSMPSFLAATAAVATAAAGHLCIVSATRRGLNPAAVAAAGDTSCFVGSSSPLGAPARGTRTSRRSAIKTEQSLRAGVSRSRWCGRGGVGVRRRRQGGSSAFGGRGLSASSDEDGENGTGENDEVDDDGIDWSKINPKPGQTPDWDKILPKGRETPDMPPAPPGLSNLDPRDRLTAYAGMLDWEPLDLDEQEEKEKTFEDLNQEMGDEWLSNKLQAALRKSQNRNVRSNVNKAYISEWLDTEKEKLEETAEDLKEAYRKDAERIKKRMMEEFDKEARVMDIKIANIIEKGKSNYTQFTGPLSDQTPFPAAVAAEFAYLAEDEAAFYEELG